MLEKVVNISPNSDYKKSTGNPKYYKKVNSYNYTPAAINDTVLISPATALLSTFGWKLKKLSKEPEKVQIIFELDDFEFDTTVQTSDLYKNQKIEYRIKKNIHGFAAEIVVIVTLSAPVNLELNENDYEKSLNALNNFFEQFKSLSVKKPNIITDQYTIDSITYDFKSSLTKEFNFINSCLIKFLEKYISLKPNFHHSRGDEDGVLIKSIHIK